MLDLNLIMIQFSDRVNHPPLFKKSLQNETVLFGSNVTLRVSFISDLHRSASWIRRRCLDDNDPRCKKETVEVKEMV